jgi:hypothetical protein
LCLQLYPHHLEHYNKKLYFSTYNCFGGKVVAFDKIKTIKVVPFDKKKKKRAIMALHRSPETTVFFSKR